MSTKKKDVLPLIFTLILFFISRMIYSKLGIHFEGDTYLSHWQFIDVDLLYTDLWRNVFYLHSQPPLLNLLTGIILQLFPSAHNEVFIYTFYTTGIALAVGIYFLGNFIGLNPWISMTLSGLFIISPSAILYGNWLSYSFILATILTLSGIFLYKFVETKNVFWGGLFFLMLAVLSLTWSLFHIAWLYTLTAFMFLLLRRDFKKVLTAALLPVLLTTSWYAKNFYLYHEFTASTWGGMNLANITTFRLPEKERTRLQKSGELSEMATIYPFRNPAVYLKFFPETPATGIPILDELEPNHQINHHHLVYIKASDYYLSDALKVIRLHPYTYLKSVWQSLYIYFHSTSDFEFLYGNRNKIKSFDLLWNRVFYGQWNASEDMKSRMMTRSTANVSWLIILAFSFSITWCIYHLYKNKNRLFEAKNMLIFFMLYNIFFVSIVGNMMEIGENNRFRFVVDPFIMIISVFSLQELVISVKKWSALKKNN